VGSHSVHGVVFGSFDFDVFLANSLDWAAREVAVEAFDTPDLQPDSRWNNSTPASLAGPPGWKPRLQASFRRNRFSATAYVRVTTTPLFDRASLRLRSLFIAVTGFLLSSAVSGIVFAQTRGLRRSEALSNELSESRELLRHESARRERLGRDIHDETLQDLYVAGLHLSRLRQQLKDRPQGIADLDQFRATLESVMRRLRAFLVAIDPSPVESGNLSTALSRLVEQAQRGTTARITLDASCIADLTLLPETNLEILHFIREATCNALRHAAPTSVEVSLKRTPGRILALVRDNGHGFDPEAAAQSGGFGLSHLQRRASALHARLEIHSVPGGPTRLSLSIPLSTS
jgi:signal transduction histidine kinase